MNKYKEALNTIVDAIRDYVSYREFDLLPSENEIYGAMALLRKLVNKADSFEWIPVSKKLPDEHDSIFAKLYETDVVNEQKAILLSLDDTYEEELISSTGKHKEDYIGQVGNIVHQQNICVLVGTTRYLYDIEFNDGARFCVDREQIEFVGENE